MDSQIISNAEIKSNLLTIYDKIGISSTRQVGYELFIELILNNLYSSSIINYIISQVGDFITSLNSKEKEPYLKLLSLIFYNPNNQHDEEENNGIPQINKNIYYIYLSPVLNILQLVIKEENSNLFPQISNIYAEIVQNVMPTDISASTRKLNMEEKKGYETLQGFCIYNIKIEDKSSRIVGSLCLTKLVENCPIVLQSQYTKIIWENINNYIDKKNFNAKVELLNCLISLILGTENLFSPYANVTLYKILDFLTDNDWLKRKLALNVIYTLIFYCKEEIFPLKDHIINFLRVLKTDKVREVREVCLLILQIFSENESPNERQPENYSAFSTQKNIKETKNTNSEYNSKKNKTEKIKQRNDLKNKNINKNNENINDEEIKSFHNSEKKEKNIEIEKQLENKEKIDFNEEKEKDDNKVKTSLGRKKSTEETNNNIPHNKLVNRKDDNTFVNEKMKIRPDPNKSIFKSNPNSAFFNQAKNNKKNDIIVMAKGDPSKYNYNQNEQNLIKEPSSNNKNLVNKTKDVLEKSKTSNNFDNKENPKKTKIDINDNNNENKNENSNINNNDNKYKNNYSKKNERENKYKFSKKDENKNINNKNKRENNTNVGFVDKQKKVDSVFINKLLSQMNNLSTKQLSLIDVMENIQTDAQQQIQALNEKIFTLDSLVDELTSELNELRNQNNY